LALQAIALVDDGDPLKTGVGRKNEGRALRKDIPDPSLVFLQL